MRIGIITGKTDEISLDKEINKKVAKKHYFYGSVQTVMKIMGLIMMKSITGCQ